MRLHRLVVPVFSVAFLIGAARVEPIQAQQSGQGTAGATTGFLVAGYGTAGWRGSPTGGGGNSFFGSVSPVLLFRFGERFLYETELEFELEEGVTQTSLEYAQLDFFLNDNVTVVAGKFLLPFGVFSERLHPTWINRFASHPPLFGHGEGTLTPLLPILADFGAMIRGSWDLGGSQALTASIFVTQGPAAEEHTEGEGNVHLALAEAPALSDAAAEGEHAEEAPLPEFQFGQHSSDVNKDKLIGGRLGWVVAPALELDVSAMTGLYDDEGSRLTALGLAAEFRKGRTELRGEGFGLWYDLPAEPAGAGVPAEPAVRANTGGFYVQVAHRRQAWEPVLRWTQTFRVSADEHEDREGFTQLGFGLNYWFTPSIALMAGYELNDASGTDLDDRFLIHWSFGF